MFATILPSIDALLRIQSDWKEGKTPPVTSRVTPVSQVGAVRCANCEYHYDYDKCPLAIHDASGFSYFARDASYNPETFSCGKGKARTHK